MKSLKKLQIILTVLSCALFTLCMSLALSVSSLFAAKAATGSGMFCAGASIRIADDKMNGIRFHVRIKSEDGNTVSLDGNDYSLETLNRLKTGIEIWADALTKMDVDRTGAWEKVEDGESCYFETKAHIYNIDAACSEYGTDEYYDWEFSYRGYYVKDDVTYYGEEGQRSLSYVAMLVKQDIENLKDDDNWQSAGELKSIYNGTWKTEYETTLNSYLPADRIAVGLPNVDKYLYRVGNGNTFNASSLFTLTKTENVAISEDITCPEGGSVSITKVSADIYQFSGTGIAELTLTEKYSRNTQTLMVEVVNAKNITTATDSIGTDVVLLNDVEIATGGAVTYGKCFVYGNGFTFDVRGGMTEYTASQGWGIINLQDGATLDNLVIVGDVYTKYGAYSMNEQNTAVVASLGGTIQNCHISHCAAPIIARGATTVVNSTLYGGTVANMIIKGGINTLENVVTANYNDGRALVGMGIVIHSDAADTTKLVLNGTLKQYNFVTETNTPTDSNAKVLYNAMFSDSCNGYHFGVSPNRYVNTGIVSMVASFNGEDITDNANTGYTGATATVNKVNGYVYTQPNTQGSVDNNYDELNDTHKATVQGDYLPVFTFDLGDQEISYGGSDDSRYLYGDVSGVKALYQDGQDFLTLDLTSLATVTKYDTYYDVTAQCKDSSGNTLTANNGVVTLSVAGEYTLCFTVTDKVSYVENGQLLEKDVERTYNVPLTLSVKDATILNATVKITTTSLTGDWVQSGFITDYDYKLKCLFLSCISVIDYDKTGTGTTVSLTSNILSATLTDVDGGTDVFGKAFKVTITYTDGRELVVNFSGIGGSSPGTKTAQVVTGSELYWLTDGALDDKPTETSSQNTCTITSVSFKGNNGATVTDDTDVTVTWALGTSSGGGCVTPDTLVTLADGTQKEIQYVTYTDKLLVWDFTKGEYTTATSSIIMNHGYDYYNVVALNFADGTVVKTINGHGFFDMATNEFVVLSNNNVEEYIGHEFVKQDGTITKLVSYSVKQEYTESWSILTVEHYNCILEGMLTLTPAEVEGSPKYLMPFEIGEGMKYDEAQIQADIEKYGLYTYEDFAEYMTYEQFEALNLSIFKVSVGKGYITWEEILYLISIHIG